MPRSEEHLAFVTGRLDDFDAVDSLGLNTYQEERTLTSASEVHPRHELVPVR
jgi:hypothetical protein